MIKWMLSFILLSTLCSVGFADMTVVREQSKKLPTLKKKSVHKIQHKRTNHHPKERTWNLREADIRSVIEEVSKETHKNFVIDPRVQGKVTVVSTDPLSADEIYQVFLSVLQVHGYSAIPNGDVIKIVPSVNANQMANPVASHSKPGKGDELVVRVMSLRHNSAEQLIPVLRPLMPPSATVSAYLPTNSIILSGTARNVKRLVHLINNLDKANQKKVEVIPLRYAIASDAVKELAALIKSPSPGTPMINITADDRSNSILISGNDAQRRSIRTLAIRLDKQSHYSNSGHTQVIFLHYLKAVDVAPILAGIAQANYGDGVTSSKTHKSSQKTVTEGKTNPDHHKDASVSITISSKGRKVEIQAEPTTNSLIISAPSNLMRTLKTIIAKLDMRPAQILVEAAIVEISQNKLQELGIKWGTRQRQGDTGSILPSGATFSALTGGLGIGFIKAENLRVMITALGEDTNTNILSTPNIIVLDNQPADIKVGKKVPFITGQYTTQGTDSIENPYTTTKREYVGLELKVTPQINQGNAVKLDIEQVNENIADTSTNSQNPTTNESSIKTSVIVNDGEILVLGGLISNQRVEKITKVPLLGDIPGVGLLFSSRGYTYEKKNLMVFLRPVILKNSAAGVRVTGTKYDYIRNIQLKDFHKLNELGLQKYPSSVLPKRHGKAKLPMPFTSPLTDYRY